MSRLARWWPIVLALAAYVPALASSPGRMPADTKLALYLDPARLTTEATTTFDAAQYAGWVPHQQIAYLWPTGPWYVLFDAVGVPDWLAHRLWLGSLLFLAGGGVAWALRRFEFPVPAALAGALVYQLSPYVLPYVSRTSALLLPFAGLGWIMGATLLATRDPARLPWRWPAAIALAVATVGAVNATALLMIVPGPALVLLHARQADRVPWRRVGLVAGLGVVACTAVSVWWIAMSAVQRARGPDVLAYSESLRAVSTSSTSFESLRGLGYWLFYVRDHLGATTTAAIDHLDDPATIASGLTLTLLSLLGLVLDRGDAGVLGASCLVVGIVLAVGVHPIDDPSPFVRLVGGDLDDGWTLALRSSSRAVPVALFGLAIGAAALVRHAPWPAPLGERLRGRRTLAAAVLVGGLALAATPSWWTASLVDPNLDRDPEPPAAWLEAAASIDGTEGGGRVLQIPGAEFGAFEWGVTVDQPLPYLADRPVLTRDLLPLGSPAAMDLLFALDDRFQDGTFEGDSLGPVAAWLGVDHLWIAGDLDVERYDTARPGPVLAEIERADAGTIRSFGPPSVPGERVVDEELLGVPSATAPLAPVTVVSPTSPGSIIRVREPSGVVTVVGSGDGLVDAAAAGVLDGSELLRPAPAIDGPVDRLVITDSHRDRAHHWRTSQDVHGFTESRRDASDLLRVDDGDERLPVFADAVDGELDDDHRTVSRQVGPVTARATGYGQPFAYLPEHRPAMAIDGDPATSWSVGEHADPIGERIVLRVADDAAPDGLTILQPTIAGDRYITRVVIEVDGEAADEIELDERSFAAPGQPIEFGPDLTGGSEVGLTIAAVSPGRPNGVGFSEIDLGVGPTTEWIETPIALPTVTADASVDVVLTRLRAEPTDRWRDDPEPELRRLVALPDGLRSGVDELVITLRLDPRADADVLAGWLGDPAVSSDHLTGAPGSRGAAAFDGDPSTAWITPFGQPIGPSVRLDGVDGSTDELGVRQPTGTYSRITELTIEDRHGALTVPVDDGPIALERPIDLASSRFTISAADLATTVDRRFGDLVVLPAAIAELDVGRTPPPTEAIVSADCATGWLTIDGRDVPISFTASSADLLAGEPIEARSCSSPTASDDSLAVETSPPAGLRIDRVVIGFRPEGPLGPDEPAETTPLRWSPAPGTDPRSVTIDACPSGCWVVLGHGFNTAWTATADGRSLGRPELVDANANGWWLEPFEQPLTVEFSWTAQGPVTLGVAISGLTVLTLVIALVVTRRRDVADGSPERSGHIHPSLGAPSWSSWAPIYVVGCAVFIAPSTLLPAVAVAALLHPRVTARRRLGSVVALASIALLAAISAVVLLIVIREHPFPGLGWPTRFARWHRPALFAVATLAAGVHAARAARGRRATVTDGPGQIPVDV